MDRSKPFILSFDLGGTNLRCGIVDSKGVILARSRGGTGQRPSPEDAAAKMAELAEEALRTAGIAKSEIACAGLGSPGPLNSQTGVIGETPNLGWKDVPMAKIVSDRLRLPAFLENDANAACWGEFWKGAGQGVRNMFIFTLGTGVGGSLILDGRLWRGPDDTAGHLGHMVIDPHGPVQVMEGNPGSVEAICSATACIRDARAAAMRNKGSLLAQIPPEKIDGAFVNDCAERGDAEAQAIFHRIGTGLGIVCASLANALNVELGVIGGGLSLAGAKILDPLRSELKRRALAIPGARLRIVQAQLKDDAGIIGAAGLALQRLKA